MDNSGGYREKYRKAVEDQERIEKQFAFQLDALKKTLFHVIAAAQGLDKHLDASMLLLKEKMRGATGQQVIEQMDRVQKAAQEFEGSRHAQSIQNAKQIQGIVEQLSLLKIPPPVKKSLTAYAGDLRKRLQSYRNYTDILQELRKLQEIALEEASQTPTTLWQRLRGGTALARDTAESEPSAKPAKKSPSATAEEDQAKDNNRPETDAQPPSGDSPPAELRDDEIDFTPTKSELQEVQRSNPVEVKFDPGSEDNYSAVAQRLARTLEGLVNRIEPNDVVRHKIDIVKLRLQRGLDWFAFAVTLEDVRDILLLRYLQNDQDFSDYLQNIHEELRLIGEALGLVLTSEEKQKSASDKLTSSVNNSMAKIRLDMENSNGIESLKTSVKQHLSAIQQAVEDFGKATKPAEDEAPINEQVAVLIERLKSVEAESERTKRQLEEQRYKATHDPLTGLFNREAYNQRSYEELQRFKRYCRPLTLAICDIDHFKKINDNYGHHAGDKILKLIAKVVSTRLRKVDFVGRFGGEEFVILMPETNTQQALEVLDKIRALIAKTPFKFKAEPVKISISFGLAAFEAEDTIESVFERADAALYQAKGQGRNRCVIAEPPTNEEQPKAK